MTTLRERAQSAFETALNDFANQPLIRSIVAGDITREQYAGLLTQIYFQTRENPQLQALSTTRFTGPARELVGKFLGHAKSEVGHDRMAQDDLRALGFSVDRMPTQNPLPETSGLMGFAFHQTLWARPIAYLGYLFFLEYTPTTVGQSYREGLLLAGLPEESMTFLDEHIGVDVAHNKLMEQYLEALLQTEEDLDAFVFALETTSVLYAHMLQAAANAGVAPYVDREGCLQPDGRGSEEVDAVALGSFSE